jgi:hypothetical protein
MGWPKRMIWTIAEPGSTEFPGMPPVDIVEEDFKTYFYITKKGMDFHLSDETWWLFGDNDEPGSSGPEST